VRRLAALALAVLITAAAPAAAAAAPPIVRDVDRPDGAAVQLVDRGPCPPCAWPATGADWGPPLTADSGETLELTLDAPADGVDLSALTNPADGSPAETVFPPSAATPGPDATTWRLTLPALGPHASEGLALAVVVHRSGAGEAASGTLVAPSVFVVPSPRPPSFAFRSIALDRARRALVVHIQTVAVLDLTVTVARRGHRIAHGSVHVAGRGVRLRLALGRSRLARLRAGQRVDVIVRGEGLRVATRGVKLGRVRAPRGDAAAVRSTGVRHAHGARLFRRG